MSAGRSPNQTCKPTTELTFLAKALATELHNRLTKLKSQNWKLEI